MKFAKIGIISLLLVFTLTIPISTPTNSQTNLFNMSYLFFGTLSSYSGQVEKTKGSLDVVAPNYFDITKEGQLDITWRLQSSFINEMHSKGTKVVPFLANHWDATAGINGLKNREQLAQDIAAAVKKYQLDGINVDIEGVGHAYRDQHTDFIRLLRQYIPNDKEVSVAVAANPNGWKTGWHGFYDYPELAKYANYLMIMAYDESWDSPDSPIGPVSSLSFFERSIQYAINQGVPKDRIVAGLPFYGRMWKLDGPTIEGKSIHGMGVSSTRVEPLVNQYNGKINFDQKTQSSYATFTIPSGQNSFIGSTNLTAGDYVIWFENEPSIKAKLRLPRKYGIKGTGSWALYHETADTWDYYKAWLNSAYFRDVASDYWAQEHIDYVSQRGWMNGTSSTTFGPHQTLTRAQGAAVLIRALGLDNLTPKEYKFNDVKGHWAQNNIEIAREMGYLQGKAPDQFDPDAPLTRQQLASILHNIFHYPVALDHDNPYSDVSTANWSYESVMALSQQGILKGYEDGTFRPKANSSRSHMAKIMHLMAEDFERFRNQ